LDTLREYQEIDCHGESQNRNQREKKEEKTERKMECDYHALTERTPETQA
jgi:hypothetical protein